MSLEAQIDQWRSYLRRRQAIHPVDVAELEDHLREQVETLVDAGLNPDEAFLVAVKRMGDLDSLSREFAREHSERLWKQLVVPSSDPEAAAAARRDVLMAVCFAVAAAAIVKVSIELINDNGFYRRNVGFFVLPLLAGYFAWKRRLDVRTINWLAVAFVVAGTFANVYPFVPGGAVEVTTALHLPVLLWLVVGVAYAGTRWTEAGGRMDFIRFSGELIIYYLLIYLCGAVLASSMLQMFEAIGINATPFFESWLFPCGAAAAIVAAAWLVEAKQSVIENMAPVLTRLFTPLFAAVLVVFLATLFWTGRGIGIERSMLIAFNLLLALALALLLYSISARDPVAPPGAFDLMQVVLVVSALVAGTVALWAIAARITQLGVTPNRVAALGANAIFLVNLGWSAVLYVRFLRGRGPFAALERWQTDYLPVYAVWAAIVVVLFPPLFRYV